ncbi:hypothetical protein BV25DRAFT_1807045 [Artomyces pyxidatus]|uniref:Uncharacterized protein n=1 Tax=Artomyces pyxidatus TaxID=48021 RepID=A0ACB8SWL3_9AGAM|nr:hypothetical protein BV25DRAFT_1807045 [Artomyces pyxidatus]
MSFSLLLSIISLGSVAYAQSGAWGQCGGQGWTGSTSCISGYTCTYSNPYYSQCLPGTVSSKSTASTTSTASGSTPTGVNYWFSFGDSYTQTQFVTSGALPSVGNPLGNPPYPGYTAVGGVNWIDQATVVSNHSLVLTYNYAYGGATIDATLVAPYEPTVQSVTDQVNIFLNESQIGTGNKIWTSSNTLFSVWIGINDIGNSYGNGGNRTAFNDVLLDAYFALVEKLVGAPGARNFLFINVPPVDRSPLMLAQSTSAQALEKSVIADYNTKLASRAANLTSTHAGVKAWLYDANTAFTTILNSPQTYGFVDATSYGNTGDFWGNNLHPSSAAQVMFGNQVGNTVLQGTVW